MPEKKASQAVEDKEEAKAEAKAAKDAPPTPEELVTDPGTTLGSSEKDETITDQGTTLDS